MFNYDIAAYVWPSYTGDEPRSRIFWPEGIGEWETVMKARAKYPGHTWPRRPLWGYCNEADPYIMEMQINAAADHGINVFIYDWYWYDGRPFLEACLRNGYLRARNNHRVKFYLMWANHDVNHLWDRRLSDEDPAIIWKAAVDRKEFEKIVEYWIQEYFSHPSYYRIQGQPVLSVFDLNRLMEGLGGIEGTRDALAWLRDQVSQRGFPGIHLQLCAYECYWVNGQRIDEQSSPSIYELISILGWDSQTHYQIVQFTNVDRNYEEIIPDMVSKWETMNRRFSIPYIPHVSVGWDTNPRFINFKPGVVKNNHPYLVQKALEKACEFLQSHPQLPPLITLNSWNEWTETSYIQPDTLYGYGYLKAIQNVVGSRP